MATPVQQTTSSTEEDRTGSTEVQLGPADLSDGIGLLVLFDNIRGDSATAGAKGFDIVFVHGLRGTRCGTWSKNNICWPRHLLEKDLHDVRVVTWGYDANIANATRQASQDGIFGHAETLLGDLARLRKGTVCPATFHS